MSLFGAFDKYPLVGAMAIPGAILAAAYMLRLLQKMVWDDSDGHGHHDHGDGHGDEHGDHHLADCNFREFIQLAFLTVFVFWIGLHPTPLLDMMDTSVAHLIHQVDAGSAVQEAVHHGEHHALLNEAGAWVKNLF